MAIATEISTWIADFGQRAAPRARLYCFPQAGAGATFFNDWPAVLPEEIEVCPVRFPGRESRITEPPRTDAEPLLDELEEVLRSHASGLPFAMLGNCSGAFLAFELARRLHPQGQPLTRLFSIAQQAPHCPRADPPADMSDESLRAVLEGLGGTPEDLLESPEMMALLGPAVRADLELSATMVYRPAAPLGIPVSVFGGRADPAVAFGDLAAWHEHTESEFSLRLFPGRHFFIGSRASQLISAIAADMQRDIGQAAG